MKKIFCTMAIAALLLVSYSVHDEKKLTDVVLANVEALATGDELKGKICFYIRKNRLRNANSLYC